MKHVRLRYLDTCFAAAGHSISILNWEAGNSGWRYNYKRSATSKSFVLFKVPVEDKGDIRNIQKKLY